MLLSLGPPFGVPTAALVVYLRTGFVHQSGAPGQFNIADQFPRRVGGQGRAILIPPLGLPHQTVIADPLPALIGNTTVPGGVLRCTGKIGRASWGERVQGAVGGLGMSSDNN